MPTADFRPANLSWLVSQADDLALSVVFTDDGVSFSAGGDPMDIGSAGDWSVKVWADRAAAEAGTAAILTASVTVPSTGQLVAAIADTALDDIDAGTDYWWAAVRTTSGSRRTWLAGRFQIEPGVLTP